MYLQYFTTVSRHKWFVLLECLKMAKETGTPRLVWRGITHDMSKFRPSEFFPYARNFNGRGVPRPMSYVKPYGNGNEAFDKAWLLHQKRNSHHWQWHILPLDDGGIKVFDMPKLDRMEMLCDWRGAARTYNGSSSTGKWYKQNSCKMVIYVPTRWWLEANIAKEL